MVDAQSCAPCGHTFCRECLSRLQRQRCPKCRTEIAATCGNAFVATIMASINGQCKACDARFTLNDANAHIKACGKIETECQRCKAMFLQEQAAAHEEECPMAMVGCVCGVRVPRRDLAEHQDGVCPRKSVPCLFRCGESVERWADL